MANVINATSTGNGGLITTGDDSGVLNIQTNETTAISIDASQNLTFTNPANLPNTFGFKNRLINGGMTINQRAVTSVSGGTEVYTLDRWIVANYFLSGAITVGQSTDAPAGFTNSLQVTNGTGEALGASDFGSVRQKIEGYNMADFAWGTASAKSIVISFWVKSSVTGNYTVGIINSALNRSNRTVFTINSANTWEQKSVTFTGDTSGTWVTNNGIGMYMDVVFVAGSNNYGTADTWTANSFEGVSGASATWVTSTNATFYITGVQVEKGTQATSFDFRSYGTELALCQRYFYQTNGSSTGILNATKQYVGSWFFPVTMRATPSMTQSGTITVYGVNFADFATSAPSPNSGFGANGGSIYFNGASTAGGSVGLGAWSYGSGLLQFSSEL